MRYWRIALIVGFNGAGVVYLMFGHLLSAFIQFLAALIVAVVGRKDF